MGLGLVPYSLLGRASLDVLILYPLPFQFWRLDDGLALRGLPFQDSFWSSELPKGSTLLLD